MRNHIIFHIAKIKKVSLIHQLSVHWITCHYILKTLEKVIRVSIDAPISYHILFNFDQQGQITDQITEIDALTLFYCELKLSQFTCF